MNVLGIETSCDETSAAVVKNGREILSNQVSSSLKFHRLYGGVIPEIASRKQLEAITLVAEAALKEAKVGLKDIDLISVTSGPGLLGSLLVGISFAKSVSLVSGIALLGVNHVYAHIYANFLDTQAPKLPFVALVVSGGHTSLFYLKDFDKIEVLGQTRDDACGEAFDKVAKILDLGYPGGPLIEKLSKQGNSKKIKLSCSGSQRQFDFSFSGIKTAVLYKARDKKLTIGEKRDLAASFQEAAIDTLIKKTLLACKLKKTDIVVIGGGVAANNRLRERFYEESKRNDLKCFFPASKLCTDNAAMVAGFGYQLYGKGKVSTLDLTAEIS